MPTLHENLDCNVPWNEPWLGQNSHESVSWGHPNENYEPWLLNRRMWIETKL